MQTSKSIESKIIFSYLGHRRAVVSKPRIDMCSREALRFPELKDRIELNKVRDHFICTYRCQGVAITLRVWSF